MNVEFEQISFENKRKSSEELSVIAREIRRDIIKMLVTARTAVPGSAFQTIAVTNCCD